MQPKPVRILVLEDDVAFRTVMAKVLETEGYAVVQAGSGAEALERARETEFDLVVADIRMEGMDGLEALEHVRQVNPQARSVVVTGYSTEDQSIRAIRMGVGDYLRKPFPLSELLDSVRNQLARRGEEQARSRQDRTLQGALRWALESLAGSLGLTEVGQTAARVGTALGLAPEAVENVRLGALLRATSQEVGHRPEGLPPALHHLLEGGQHLEARIVELALAAVAEEPLEGRFDERLVAALKEPEPHDESSKGSRRRGLISVGRALAMAGDLEASRQAFRDVLAEERPSREGVEACLALARLDPGGRGEHLDRALEMAEQIGAVAAAGTALEAGLLGKREASLEKARQLFSELRLPVGEAQARLALDQLGDRPADPESLDVLLAPEHSEALASTAPWLLPLLLRSRSGGADGPVERALRRLVVEARGTLLRLLTPGRLGVAEKRAAAEVLGGLDQRVREEPLTVLARDEDPEVRSLARRALETEGSAPLPPLLRIYCLGYLELFRGEEAIPVADLRSRHTRHLLAFLAARGEATVAEDVVLESLWPDVEGSKKKLYWSVSVLRKALRGGDSGWDYVLRTPQGLRLNPELPRWHDLSELEALLEQGDPGRARRAVELYRGPYLEGCYDDWAVRLRDRIERQVTELLSRSARWALEQGSQQEALEYTHRLLDIDPLHQEAHLVAMRAYNALARPQDALRQFQQCEQALKRELELEPHTDLLYERQRALLTLG